MKSLISSLLLVLLLASPSLQANNSKLLSLSFYPHLEEALELVYEVHYDMGSFFKVEELNDFSSEGIECAHVSSDSLKKLINEKFKKVSDFYPDEETSFNEARRELDQYLGGSNYLRCERIENKDKYQIISHFYQSLEDGFPVFLIEFEKPLR